MSDPTQFIVNLATIHRLMHHQGLLSVGRDRASGQNYTLHSYTDDYKKNYAMQLFDSLDPDAVSNKLSALTKYSHSLFVPNVVRPIFISTRKNTKNTFELSVFYETTSTGQLSLWELINAKKNQGQKFQTEQITSFFWQIADFLILAGKGGSQYLDFSPGSIICKLQGYCGYNFFISNFNQHIQESEIYHNKADQFYNGSKTIQAAISASMFTFGLVLLQISSLLPTSQLFEKGVMNQKTLAKRIQGIKITNDRMIANAIKGLLQLDEAKRLKPVDIFKNEEWLKLRKVMYFSSKTDFYTFKNFEGIIEYDKKTAIGEGLDQNLNLHRGTFINGVLQGRGVKQVKDSLEIGLFVNNSLVEGQIVKKNCYTDFGKIKNGKIIQGLRITLNVANPPKNSSTINGFIGQFEQNEPKNGKKIYTDGFEELH